MNYFKARLKNELNAAQIEAEKKFGGKLSEFNELQKKKRERTEKLQSAFQSRRLEYVRSASNLKILVPDVLKELYDYVVNFSGLLV